MYYVYVLKSQKDGNNYVGMTSDLKRRLVEHDKGKNVSTKYRKPFCLIYFEYLKSQKKARIREKYFKSAAGRKFIRKSYQIQGSGVAQR